MHPDLDSWRSRFAIAYEFALPWISICSPCMTLHSLQYQVFLASAQCAHLLDVMATKLTQASLFFSIGTQRLENRTEGGEISRRTLSTCLPLQSLEETTWVIGMLCQAVQWVRLSGGRKSSQVCRKHAEDSPLQVYFGQNFLFFHPFMRSQPQCQKPHKCCQEMQSPSIMAYLHQ